MTEPNPSVTLPDRDVALEHLRKVMRRNLEGFVVREYDVRHDRFLWVYGFSAVPALLDVETAEPFPEDPTTGLEEYPISKWAEYMTQFYIPRAKLNAAKCRQPEGQGTVDYSI